jgi:threonine dehydrogenase-like Zn-dependent dehydrogenase
MRAATEYVAPRGRIVIAGLGKGPFDLDMTRVTYNNINIQGVWGGNTAYSPEVANLMAAEKLDLEPLFTSMPLSEWEAAFRAARARKYIKILLDPSN